MKKIIAIGIVSILLFAGLTVVSATKNGQQTAKTVIAKTNSGSARVYGYVTNLRGEAIPNAWVTIYGDPFLGPPHWYYNETCTDSNGFYEFGDLILAGDPADDYVYVMQAGAHGYRNSGNIGFFVDYQNNRIDIKLTKKIIDSNIAINRPFLQFLQNFFEKYPNAFPMLQTILQRSRI
jgi:hypothetical protein